MLKQKEFLKTGDIQERIGHCLNRVAKQTENREEFKQRMQEAVEAYQKAHGFYEQLGAEQKARIFRCKADVKYLGYWLTSDPAEKRKLLDECLNLEGKALALFFDFGDMREYGRTYNELFEVFWHRSVLEWNRDILRSVVDNARAG